jgi:hypothetical protein
MRGWWGAAWTFVTATENDPDERKTLTFATRVLKALCAFDLRQGE